MTPASSLPQSEHGTRSCVAELCSEIPAALAGRVGVSRRRHSGSASRSPCREKSVRSHKGLADALSNAPWRRLHINGMRRPDY